MTYIKIEGDLMRMPFFCEYFRFLSDRLAFFEKIFEKDGYVSEVNFGIFGRIFFLFHPKDINLFFKKGKRLHRKDLNKILGNSLFTMDTGSEAIERKAKIQKCFHLKKLQHIVDSISSITYQTLELHLKNKSEISILPAMQEITQKIRILLIFGETCTQKEEATLLFSIRYLLHYLNCEFEQWIPRPNFWNSILNSKIKKYACDQKLD